MAYNYYLPQQPYYQSTPMAYNGSNLPPNAQPTQSNQITWVQGEAAAKAYPVAAGQSVLLMDSETSVMYIKSTDQSGMPQPLRIFEYKERTAQKTGAGVASNNDYVPRNEFNEFKEMVLQAINGDKSTKEGEG